MYNNIHELNKNYFLVQWQVSKYVLQYDKLDGNDKNRIIIKKDRKAVHQSTKKNLFLKSSKF